MIRLLFFFLLSYSVFAQEVNVTVTSPIRHQSYPLGIGSRVQLEIRSRDTVMDAIFLGRMVDQERKSIEFLFLNEKKTRIMMIDPNNLMGLKSLTTQAIISPIDQRGSTCTAYGIFHFWNQTYASRIKGTKLFTETMNSDRMRMQFLEEIIDIYYIQNKTNITTLMNRIGKSFGFTCRNNRFSDARLAAEFLYRSALGGTPILIDFNIGSQMVSSTYEVTDYEKPSTRDPRLWIPRQVGDRATSGHVIVGAAAFVSKGRKKLLVLDSNWTEPRVWDLERYVARKAAVKEMGFHTCLPVVP